MTCYIYNHIPWIILHPIQPNPNQYHAMEQPRIDRLMRIMKMMTGNRTYTVEEMAQRLETSYRTVYRYIQSFKEAGFVVLCKEHKYRLSKESKYFKEISQLIHFTDEEAYIVNKLIDNIDDTNLLKQNLRKKLATIYDLTSIADVIVKGNTAANVHEIIEAIHGKKQIILKRYSSSHSGESRDRLVEPYGFTTNYVEIWCYDVEDRQNKLFKTTRISAVEITEKEWEYEAQHTKGFIDIFRFTGFEQYPVKLLLGMLAHNLILEEYPLAEKDMVKATENHWFLETRVCHYAGVCRFYLGLADDIQIVDSPELVEYIGQFKEKYLKSI